MSKFDELKAAAELAMKSGSDFEYDVFQSTYGPQKFLELLAIQAQLVEGLEAMRAEYLDTLNSAYCQVPVKQELVDEVDAILAAAGEQP